MIDICILSYNRKRITELCLREIQRRTLTPHRLVVLDNGSKDGSWEMICRLGDEGLVNVGHRVPENRGVHGGFNRILDFVKGPLFICSDNDIIPQAPDEQGRDWLSLLLSLAEDHPGYGAISLLPHALIGDSLSRWLEGSGPIIERPHAGAVLRLMRTSLLRHVGGWRQDAAPSRNNEERWIASRLKSIGYKVGYARDIRAIHLWGDPSLGEDDWGYPLGSEHGHRPVSPPPHKFNWDLRGIDWETCRKEDL